MKLKTSPLVRVALAVIERRGRYLVGRRTAASHLGGLWEFPGGKRRSGETWRACLEREVREELDVTVDIVERIASFRFRYPDRSVELVAFRCVLEAGRPKPLACDELRWVTARQLASLPFPPANRRLIEGLAKPLSSGRTGVRDLP